MCVAFHFIPVCVNFKETNFWQLHSSLSATTHPCPCLCLQLLTGRGSKHMPLRIGWHRAWAPENGGERRWEFKIGIQVFTRRIVMQLAQDGRASSSREAKPPCSTHWLRRYPECAAGLGGGISLYWHGIWNSLYILIWILKNMPRKPRILTFKYLRSIELLLFKIWR